MKFALCQLKEMVQWDENDKETSGGGIKVKVKVKSLYLTSVVPSVTRLVSMEADGAPFNPLPLSVLRFTGIRSYGYTDQRKVETDV